MPKFTNEQLLSVLTDWSKMEAEARCKLFPNLYGRNGEELLKILLLAFLNTAHPNPLNKSGIRDEIAKQFKECEEAVDERFNRLKACRYLTGNKNDRHDGRNVVLVPTDEGKVRIAAYGAELIRITGVLYHQLGKYGPLPSGDAIDPANHSDIVQEMRGRNS